jgi:CheY-like chemotaxis protein
MSKRILLIEEGPDIIVYLTTLFEENGYEVSSAFNGKEGAQKLIHECSVQGPEGYIDKPIDRALLLETVLQIPEGQAQSIG